jgi:hypothetical protein
MLLKFQRKNLIETSSSSSDSDDNNMETLKLMESKNPMARLVVYGKLKRMMESFKNAKLLPTEKNLLRGIFVRRLKDFKEEYKEKMESVTLIERLTGMPIDVHNSTILRN